MGPTQGQDLLIVGHVKTMDPANPTAEAVLVQGGRIAYVGSVEDGRSAAPSAREIDAGGGTILPGFHDAHIHPLHGGLARLQCGLHEAAGLEEYQGLIQAYAAEHPDEPWILGSGWAMDAFAGGNPRREDLDAVVPDRPVALTSRDVHSLWANSRALEVAGIGPSTRDPSDGVIVRDGDGSPAGTLHESAMALVQAAIPDPSPEQELEALVLAQRELHALGIVSWQDAWVERPTLERYLDLARDDLLTAHVVLSSLWDRDRDASQISDLEEMRRAATEGGLDASTVKIFLDGIVESFTALLLEPYLDAHGEPTENRGMELVPRQRLLAYAPRLDAAGFQLHFHAIGDGAVRLGLDAIEAARSVNGPRDARHHISHLQIVHPDDIPRFGRLGAIANAQPLWAYMDDQMRDLNVPFLGAERTGHQYPFAGLLRSGARLAMGSDWPVSSADPLLEMEVAVRRSDPDARTEDVFLPHERLSLEEALTGFTRNSAFVNRLDDSGRLAKGMRADVIVLDRDLRILDDGRLSKAHVVLTLADGRIVHQS